MVQSSCFEHDYLSIKSTGSFMYRVTVPAPSTQRMKINDMITTMADSTHQKYDAM